MAEKVDERRIQMASNGSPYITLPRSYVEDMGLEKKSLMEVFREGDSIIMRPKKGKEEKRPDGSPR